MSYFTHAFEAPISRHGVGRARKVWYNVLFLPGEVATDLPFDRHAQLRVEGEIGDVPMAGAFISAGDGRWYVIVSPQVLKDGGLTVGDMVEMRFRIADQEAVDVPAELASALRRDPAAAAAWDALTTGRRRALAYHVATAKAAATRTRRIAAILCAIAGREPDEATRPDVERLAYLLTGKRRGTG